MLFEGDGKGGRGLGLFLFLFTGGVMDGWIHPAFWGGGGAAGTGKLHAYVYRTWRDGSSRMDGRMEFLWLEALLACMLVTGLR